MGCVPSSQKEQAGKMIGQQVHASSFSSVVFLV